MLNILLQLAIQSALHALVNPGFGGRAKPHTRFTLQLISGTMLLTAQKMEKFKNLIIGQIKIAIKGGICIIMQNQPCRNAYDVRSRNE